MVRPVLLLATPRFLMKSESPVLGCPGPVLSAFHMIQSDLPRPVSVGSVPGAIDGLKLVDIGNGKFAVAFYGQASPNGTLYNSELAEEPLSSGRMYTKVFVRHWDSCMRFCYGRPKCPADLNQISRLREIAFGMQQ